MADVTATSYSNDQNAFTSETDAFEDLLDLRTRKNSVIGELVWSYAKENRTFNAGYRGAFGFLRSDLSGSGVTNVRTRTAEALRGIFLTPRLVLVPCEPRGGEQHEGR